MNRVLSILYQAPQLIYELFTGTTGLNIEVRGAMSRTPQ